MTTIEDRLLELMERMDHSENRIQPSDKSLVFEAIQRLRCAYKDVRELEDELDHLKNQESVWLLVECDRGLGETVLSAHRNEDSANKLCRSSNLYVEEVSLI